MRKTITVFILLLALFIASNVYAYTVDGHVYLDGETDHSGITVAFERTAPDSWNGSTSTNSSGYYTIELDLGVYDITYTKDGYDSASETDKLINSNTTLNDVTLNEHLYTINVPSDFASIQSAIDYALDGDVILVQPGTYTENINYSGKNITVASLYYTTNDENYISTTIIDGNENGSVVIFNSGEDITAVLSGFTITGGSDNYGGGIRCYNNSKATLENLSITGNNCNYSGGGVCCIYYSYTILENVTIIGNSSGEMGGGIYFSFESGASLNNVTITDNEAVIGYGGGIY